LARADERGNRFRV
jgi:chromosome segregation ATPase